MSRQFNHAKWEGFTFEDIIMPLFRFIVGRGMPFSFSKHLASGRGKPPYHVEPVCGESCCWHLFLLNTPICPTGRSFAEVTPPAHRLANAAWTLGDTEDAVSLWTKEEAVALHKKLCGKRAKVSKHLTGPFSILVGTPENNRFVNQAAAEGLIEIARLAKDLVIPQLNVLR